MQNTKEEISSKHSKGALFTVLGGVLWGFSGTCGQYLMQHEGIVSKWLVPYRLLIAGIILLLICYFKMGRQIFSVWKSDAAALLVFALFGVSLCQFSYFSAIGYSNAATATVLQYTSPVLIMTYYSLKNRRIPKSYEIAALCLTVIGVFLLATHGKPGTMLLSKETCIWGLIASLTLGIYTVQPIKMLEKFTSPLITGWGMLIGGIILMALFRPWKLNVHININIILGMFGVIVFGTIIAFTIYLEGVRLIGAKKGSLFASIEPVAALSFSVLWMKEHFEIVDVLGFICIISTIFILTLNKEKNKNGKKDKNECYPTAGNQKG